MVSFSEAIRAELKTRLRAPQATPEPESKKASGVNVEEYLDSFGSIRNDAAGDVSKNSLGTFEERLALYARLEKRRRELEKAVDYCKGEADRLAPRLQEEMAENGIENTRVEGLSIFTKSNFYCSKKADKDGVTTEMICDVLRDLGMGQIVSEGYAASTLKTKVKEWIDNKVTIPEQLEKLINYGTTTTLSTRL